MIVHGEAPLRRHAFKKITEIHMAAKNNFSLCILFISNLAKTCWQTLWLKKNCDRIQVSRFKTNLVKFYLDQSVIGR
jgi:hypothetical protein